MFLRRPSDVSPLPLDSYLSPSQPPARQGEHEIMAQVEAYIPPQPLFPQLDVELVAALQVAHALLVPF